MILQFKLSFILQSKASNLLYHGKGLIENDIEESIETLKLANSVCEGLSLFSNKQEISFKINKNLAKLYLKMKKKKEAIKRIQKCYEVDRDAYVVSNLIISNLKELCHTGD